MIRCLNCGSLAIVEEMVDEIHWSRFANPEYMQQVRPDECSEVDLEGSDPVSRHEEYRCLDCGEFEMEEIPAEKVSRK